MTPCSMSSGIEPRRNAITGVPHAIASTTLKPEGLVEPDQVQQRAARRRAAPSVGRADGPEIAHAVAVDPWRDLLVEVLLVLDDPGDDQRQPDAAGDVDRLGRALVGVNAPEEQQVARRGLERRSASVSMPWWMVAGVVEARVTVGVADCDVGASRRCIARRRAGSLGDENPWIVVTTGVSTSALYVSGRKSKLLWMMSNSPARSNTAAMCRHSRDLRRRSSDPRTMPRGTTERKPGGGQRVAGGEQGDVDARARRGPR